MMGKLLKIVGYILIVLLVIIGLGTISERFIVEHNFENPGQHSKVYPDYSHEEMMLECKKYNLNYDYKEGICIK